MGQIVAAAHANHRSSAGFSCAVLRFSWDVRKVHRMAGIGDVDNRSPVRLGLPCKRVKLLAAVVPDVGDPACSLLLDNGLIRASGLQVAVAHQVHVARPRASLRERRRRQQA
ncbi:MAG: hypothetical protein JWO19_2797 [Bryobacterales bacterium]|nr:hypothetical protein [Bryobacterales bacterium]